MPWPRHRKQAPSKVLSFGPITVETKPALEVHQVPYIKLVDAFGGRYYGPQTGFEYRVGEWTPPDDLHRDHGYWVYPHYFVWPEMSSAFVAQVRGPANTSGGAYQCTSIRILKDVTGLRKSIVERESQEPSYLEVKERYETKRLELLGAAEREWAEAQNRFFDYVRALLDTGKFEEYWRRMLPHAMKLNDSFVAPLFEPAVSMLRVSQNTYINAVRSLKDAFPGAGKTWNGSAPPAELIELHKELAQARAVVYDRAKERFSRACYEVLEEWKGR